MEYLVGRVLYLLNNVFSQAPVGMQVRRALGHAPRLAISAREEQKRIGQDERLGKHQLHRETDTVLVSSLVQRVAGVKQLEYVVQYMQSLNYVCVFVC